MGLTLWIAILSLLATVHSDVFEQDEEPLPALFRRPYERVFWESTRRNVNLSDLLMEKMVSENEEHVLQESRPLYVFAIDISKSMDVTSVSIEEIEQFRAHLAIAPGGSVGESCLERNKKDYTGFDIARSELCRYIETLPDNVRVALWTFGTKAQMVFPIEKGRKGPKFEVLQQVDTTGAHTSGPLFDEINKLEATDPLSDFQNLLANIEIRYNDEIILGHETHIIIISDFFHDIGGNNMLSDNKQNGLNIKEVTLWISRYRASTAMISDYLKMMSKNGCTFHFAIVSGSSRSFCAVLPLANDSLEWYSYRQASIVDPNSRKDFDFLHHYTESEREILFYYTPGNQTPRPVNIMFDKREYQGGKLQLSLATQARSSEVFPVALNVNDERNGKEQEGIIRLGEGGAVVAMDRTGDWIELEPTTTLEPREAMRYRLLLSWQRPYNSKEVAERPKTFIVPVKFVRSLSWYGAAGMIVSHLAIAGFLLWFIIRAISHRGLAFVRADQGESLISNRNL